MSAALQSTSSLLTDSVSAAASWIGETALLGVENWQVLIAVAVLAIPVYLALREVLRLIGVAGQAFMKFWSAALAREGDSQRYHPVAVVRRVWRGMKYVLRHRKYGDETPRYLLLPVDAAAAALVESSDDIWDLEYVRERFSNDDSTILRAEQGELLNPGWDCTSDFSWPGFVKDIVHDRPERPLDGLIITVSRRFLIDSSNKSFGDSAKQLGRLIRSVDEQTDFALPVYFLLTGMEPIEGFSSFWSCQPSSRLGELIGWSNPSELEPLNPADLPAIFAGVVGELQQVQLHHAALGNNIEDPDGFFVFPYGLQSLQKSFQEWSKFLVRDPNILKNKFVRGIFFTGRAPHPDDEEHQRLAFLANLFRDKICAEKNIAYPLNAANFSRNKIIRNYQLTLVSLFAVWILWAGIDLRNLSQQAAETSLGISRIDELTRNLEDGQARVFQEIDAMAQIPANSYFRATIPLSWFGITDRNLEDHFANSVFADSIFPELQCELQGRFQALSELPTQAEIPAGSNRFQQWFDALQRYDQNLARFEVLSQAHSESIAESDVLPQFVQLIEYLYDSQPSSSFLRNDELYRRALVNVSFDTSNASLPCPYTAAQKRQEFAILSSTLLQLATTQVAAFVAQVGQVLAPPPVMASILSNGTVGDSQSLAQVKGIVDGYWTLLNRWGNDWLTASNSSPCQGMLAMVNDHVDGASQYFSSLYTQPVQQQLAQSFGTTDCRGAVRNALTSATGASPFVLSDDSWQISPGIQQVVNGLVAAEALSLLNASLAPVTWRSDFDFYWDAAVLREVTNYLTELGRLTATLDVGNPMQRTFKNAAARAIRNGYYRAQRENPSQYSYLARPVSAQESRLADQVANFRTARDLLLESETLLAQFDLAALRSEFTEFSAGYALARLNDVQNLAVTSRLYQKQPAPDWNSPSFAAALFELSAPGQLSDYLVAQRARMNFLTFQYAEPLIVYLMNLSPSESAENFHLYNSWLQTLVEFDKYQKSDPTSTLALLDQFFSRSLLSQGVNDCAQYTGTIVNGGGVNGEGDAGAGSSGAGVDWFSKSQRDIQNAIGSYCYRFELANVQQEYAAVQQSFNALLSRKFPFAEPNQSNELTLQALEYFLQQNPLATSGLASRMTQLSRVATDSTDFTDTIDFLRHMEAVEAFFNAAGIGLNPPAQPNLSLAAEFLADPTVSSQILYWWLHSGDESARNPPRAVATASRLNWQPGERLALRLQWASGASVQPLPAPPPTTTDGLEVTFSAAGTWALLRWIQNQAAPPGSTAFPVGDMARLLRFTVPLQRREQPPPAVDTSVHLRLQVFGIDPDSNMPTLLAVPYFPPSAPALEISP